MNSITGQWDSYYPQSAADHASQGLNLLCKLEFIPWRDTSQSNPIINAWPTGGRQQPLAMASTKSVVTSAACLFSFLPCHFPSVQCWGRSALLLCPQASDAHSQALHSKIMEKLSYAMGLPVWCFLLHCSILQLYYPISTSNTKPIFNSGKWPRHFFSSG